MALKKFTIMNGGKSSGKNTTVIGVFHDKIKFYALSQNLHPTCSSDSLINPGPKNEMVHETNFR